MSTARKTLPASARIASLILRSGLNLSLSGLCIGLFASLALPSSALGNYFFEYSLFILVLTPPVKSLVLGYFYLREGKYALGAVALIVFLIVVGIWYLN